MTGIIKRLATPVAPPIDDSLEPFWSDARRRIDDGAITPLVSNRVTAALFGVEPGQLAQAWAEDIHSPLSPEENSDMARVAQYHSVQLRDPVEAKRQYLEALKGYLVAGAHDNPAADPDLVAEYVDEKRREAASFSELARQLGYPHDDDPTRNPLRLLAELPLPLYITTCHHQFLEHALLRTGHKKPRLEILYWHDGLRRIPSVFAREPDYVPSAEQPLVYHLFGLDEYPESLVLTEDDHLDYLAKLSTLRHEVKYAEKELDIPAFVSLALTGTALLLLGYHVYDWDFRTLFKGLVQATGESRAMRMPKSVAMQMEPQAGDAEKQEEIKAYLGRYFEQSHFGVYWGDMDSCIQRLYQIWKGG
jgi:hypothetical protein